LVELGVAQGNGAAEPLKVGESSGAVWRPCQSRAKPGLPGREGVETGWVASKDPVWVYGEGTVQTTNARRTMSAGRAAAKAEVV